MQEIADPPADAPALAAAAVAGAAVPGVPVSALETERLARIIEIQQAIATTSLDMEQVIEAVLEGARALTRAEGVGLVMRDGIDFPLRGATSTGPARSAARQRADEPSLVGECLRTGAVLRCDDTEKDARVHRASSRASGTRSILYMPVIDGADVIGVVGMLSRRPHAFTDRDEQSLTLVAGLLSAALARAATFEANQALLAQRTAALAALRESEERYRSVTERIREVLFETDPDGHVSFLSAAWQTITGFDIGESVGVDLLDLVWPEDLPAALAAMRPLLRGHRDECSQVLRYRTRDGGMRWLEMRMRRRDDETGRILGTVGTLNDVTERRNLEQQLAQAQKLEAIGQLAAGIAHEINTPVQYVGDNLRFVEGAIGEVFDVVASLQRVSEACRDAGFRMEDVATADALVARADLDFLAAELPAAMHQALEGTGRIAEIARGMKAFSHPGTGAATPTDLNAQLEAAITVSRNEWTYVSDVTRDLDPTLPLVTCRIGEINQVFLNIIINAAQAIAEKQSGGDRRRGTIRVSSRRDGAWVEVCVADTGCGIPREARSRVFDPFYTTRAVGKGTGQGLSIAHGVVEKHGGRITFDTELDTGTTFRVRLPIAGPGFELEAEEVA
jgi:PAS domain S-box-containing protein